MSYFSWILFHILILAGLYIDLRQHKKNTQEPSIKDSFYWFSFWILMALAYGGYIYYIRDLDSFINYITAFLIEKSLSIDNIFVFILIFQGLGIPEKYQRNLMFWGIMGAVVMRLILILSGIALLQKFDWLIYIFGGFLIYTGIKTFITRFEKEKIETQWIKKYFPFTDKIDSDKLFVMENSVKKGTPLLLALILIELTDLIFAADSIPAVLAFSQDPLIVYTSNIFAILGLRSLFLILHNSLEKLVYLKTGLAIILIFVGIKMCIGIFFHLPAFLSLVIIILIMMVTILFSVVKSKHGQFYKT